MTTKDIQKDFNKLLDTIRRNQPGEDLDMVKLAFEYADKAHQGQFRASGEPYIAHPLAIAQILADMNLDTATIIAGLLHDVPEDTPYTLEDVKKNFGREIANMVDGVTKLGIIKYRGIERYAENLRKMFVAMSNDIRVILIKFADCIHNLQTLDALPPDKRLRIARESLEIYAPIADRLSMGQIKGQIEDLAFKYVLPQDYQWINQIIPKRQKQKERNILRAKKIILKKIVAEIEPIKIISIHGRSKHTYSLYNKLLKPHINRDISKVYDLIALRIIVSTVNDCYAILGLIHKIFKPLPDRVKDYIAQPKPNGYQSLHTTVYTTEGDILEIQIRTAKMHKEAELGVAAHWYYKETGAGTKKPYLKWLEELISWQKQNKSSEQFLEKVKMDIFRDRIFVFSPKGDVFDLPQGSTPVDFAYRVHTSLGNKYSGAKVNNQITSSDHQLKSGDLVEIITDKNRKSPNADWLGSVKTHEAKSKIRSAIKKLRELIGSKSN